MRNIIVHKKKKAFTMIEMIAVIFIIMILSAILFPNVTGYINEAKKVKVVDQCRKVVMAVETYNMKGTKINNDESIDSILSKTGMNNYITEEDLPNINIENTDLQDCYDIVKGGEFNIIEGEDGMVLDSES